jgi:fructan beta-fructosidase
MLTKICYWSCLVLLAACNNASDQQATNAATDSSYYEQHRPQVHFSPKEKWMNDPNGMVYYNNVYHLFYQYYPDSTVWGPMHWGHATSTDMVHWEHQPVALYPDSLGYIFSGSAVVDVNNTSGFGKDGQVPLVAIFTHHDPNGEKQGKTTYQNQSIAYSLDEGKTWAKYAGNPVLKNPGIKDFRDPKVDWHEQSRKWIMTLATLDRITFYSSPNLKDWTKESEFGYAVGAHGGVWECPDLFPLTYNNDTIWVLLVSINPGGPNGGSATQYFTGRFDGKTFTPFQTDTRWIDYGPDDYAGVTWSNLGGRRVFLGWMSNWQYGQVVPTVKWRSAMTVPRDLALEKIGDKYFLRSIPVPELDKLADKAVMVEGNEFDIVLPAKLKLTADDIADFSITFSNSKGEKLVVGYDAASNGYFIDRSASGKVDFEETFGSRFTAPRFSDKTTVDLTLIIDVASVELFADNGLGVMTGVFFPGEVYGKVAIEGRNGFKVKGLEYARMKPSSAK